VNTEENRCLEDIEDWKVARMGKSEVCWDKLKKDF